MCLPFGSIASCPTQCSTRAGLVVKNISDPKVQKLREDRLISVRPLHDYVLLYFIKKTLCCGVFRASKTKSSSFALTGICQFNQELSPPRATPPANVQRISTTSMICINWIETVSEPNTGTILKMADESVAPRCWCRAASPLNGLSV